ncbi:MAG: hypothetical protein JW965_01020 [Bacteroidales bacterium]|nr:hypothetical protein [Bacteroidales bacterium]
MHKKLILVLFGTMLLGCALMRAQEIVKPNYGLKSPETIEVIRVRLTGSQTLVDMSIQNLVRGGYFCIDENTYLEYGNGMKLKMQKVSGLPLCPDRYEFRTTGEKVYFTLYFDELPEDIDWFDIVEYCGENCFSVFALNLDEEINEKINAAFSAMDRLEPEQAIEIFRNMLPSLRSCGHGITGSVYLNLVELLAANNLDDQLRQLVSDFRESNIPHKQRYLEILNNLEY